MAVFDIGKGATFGGPDQLSYFDATKGLASLARQNSNALRNQRDALKYLEPVRDGLSGHEFLSSKNYSDYSKIMAEHGITPDALDDAMVGFMNSNGDPQYLTAVTTAFNKVRSDPRVRNIFKSEAVAKGKYDDYVKGEYNYVAPIFARSLDEFDKTGNLGGLALNYPEIEMDSYIQDLKEQFTTKGKGSDVDLDNFRYSEYDFEVGDLKGLNNAIQNRLINDHNFRAQMESKAINSGIGDNLINPDGLPSDTLKEFTLGFFGNFVPNFGEERVTKSYKSEDLNKEKIAQLKREGKITEEQANDLTEGMDGQIDAILQEQGWENTAVNRSAARKILEDGVPAAVVTQLLKGESSKNSGSSSSVSSKDIRLNEDDWRAHVENTYGVEIPDDRVSEMWDYWKEKDYKYDRFLKRFGEDIGYENDSAEVEEKVAPSGPITFEINFDSDPIGELTRASEEYQEAGEDFGYGELTGEEAYTQLIEDIKSNSIEPTQIVGSDRIVSEWVDTPEPTSNIKEQIGQNVERSVNDPNYQPKELSEIVEGVINPAPEIEESTTWSTKGASVNLQKLSDKAKGVFSQLVDLFPSAKSENIIVTDAYNEGRQSHAGGDSIDLRIRDNEGTISEAADLSRWLLLTEEGQNFAEENELLIKLEYKTDKEKEQWKEFLNLTDEEYNKLVEDSIIYQSPKTTGPHIHINVGKPKLRRGMRVVDNEYNEEQQAEARSGATQDTARFNFKDYIK